MGAQEAKARADEDTRHVDRLVKEYQDAREKFRDETQRRELAAMPMSEELIEEKKRLEGAKETINAMQEKLRTTTAMVDERMRLAQSHEEKTEAWAARKSLGRL